MSHIFIDNQTVVHRAIRFAIIGVCASGIHTIVAVICIKYFIVLPHWANGIAFVVANVISYIFNTVWSFSTRLSGYTFFKFFLVSVLGFFLTLMIAWCADQLGLHYLIGILCVIFMVPLVTFTLHNLWTYPGTKVNKT